MAAAVLLTESEPRTRTLLERQLTDNGFAVLSTAEEGRPHLVLTGDVEAVHNWSGEVPVIVLGQEEAGVVERVRAFELGCDDYGETAYPSRFSMIGGRLGPFSCLIGCMFATLSESRSAARSQRAQCCRVVPRATAEGPRRRTRPPGWLVTSMNPWACTMRRQFVRFDPSLRH